jgi:hypothetical protein
MKVATFVIIALFALSTAALAVSPISAMPDKDIQITDPGKPDGREGGETMATAWVIYALPFNDTGNTCDNINDYDAVCPYTGSTSPDVVYVYECPYDMCVSISLCNSFYDTKVYVFEDVINNVPLDGCNDDNFDCVSPPVSYTSWIPSVQFLGGHTYYIVIDGYGEECGKYVLETTEVDCPIPCDITCDGWPEGEPTCYDNYEDHHNGGCNSTPNVFIEFATSRRWCGESGVFCFGSSLYRDTDWYLCFPIGGTVTLTLNAEFGAIFGFVDVDGCQNPQFIDYAYAYPCETATLASELEHSFVAIFVAPDSWTLDYECGCEYSLDVDGWLEPWWSPVEPASWGAVKALYR